MAAVVLKVKPFQLLPLQLTGDQNWNLGLCPDREPNPQPLGVGDGTPTTWAPRPGLTRFLIRWFIFSLSVESSLHSLDNSPLPRTSFANIFSQSVACHLTPLTVDFTEQKFLIVMKSSLSIISFTDHALGVASKKSSPLKKKKKKKAAFMWL